MVTKIVDYNSTLDETALSSQNIIYYKKITLIDVKNVQSHKIIN